MTSSTVLERFLAKVIPEPNSGCWLWLGAYNPRTGYGNFKIPPISYMVNAHRASWYLHYGEMPGRLIEVCHKCDTRLCVNPEHLWLGSRTDNARDASGKGRLVRDGHRRGSLSGNVKLTEAQVIEIKQSTLSNSELADYYGVVKGTIWNIRAGLTWGWLYK